MFQWETKVAEFSTGVVDPRVGIFLSSLKISDRYNFSHAIKKTVPSSLVSHMEMPEQNSKKIKISTKPTNHQNVHFISTKTMHTQT